MIDFFFAMIAVAAARTGPSDAPIAPLVPPASVVILVPDTPGVAVGGAVQIGGGTVIAGAPAPMPGPLPVTPQIDEAVIPAGLQADPQTPTGTFTTAAEIKPILNATKANWAAVRAYDGSDLVYVTHVWSWRCGLKALAISINDEPMQNWPLPACHDDYAAPNAILPEDGLPYLKFKLDGVKSVTIQVVYDDLSRDIARFERAEILIP